MTITSKNVGQGFLVKLSGKDKESQCVITKVTTSKIYFEELATENHYAVPITLGGKFKKGDFIVPKDHWAVRPPFKKGDLVYWTDDNGQEQKGLIVKGGEKPSFQKLGYPYVTYTIHKSMLKKGDFSLPEIPQNPMSDYSLKKVNKFESMSEDSLAFTAVIYYKSKAILEVKNDGYGGCNSYHLAKKAEPEDKEKLNVAIKGWVKFFDLDDSETLDIWVAWFMSEKDHGIIPKKFEFNTTTSNN